MSGGTPVNQDAVSFYGTVEGFQDFFSAEEMMMLELIDTPTDELTDTDRVEKNLVSATAVIDSIFPPALQAKTKDLKDEILEHICYEFARYFLDKNMLRETVEKRYQQAMKLLERLAKDAKDGVLGNEDEGGGVGTAFKSGSVGFRVSAYESILSEV